MMMIIRMTSPTMMAIHLHFLPHLWCYLAYFSFTSAFSTQSLVSATLASMLSMRSPCANTRVDSQLNSSRHCCTDASSLLISLNLSSMSLTVFCRVMLACPQILRCNICWASSGFYTYSWAFQSSISRSISFTCLITLSFTVVLNSSSQLCCFCRTSVTSLLRLMQKFFFILVSGSLGALASASATLSLIIPIFSLMALWMLAFSDRIVFISSLLVFSCADLMAFAYLPFSVCILQLFLFSTEIISLTLLMSSKNYQSTPSLLAAYSQVPGSLSPLSDPTSLMGPSSCHYGRGTLRSSGSRSIIFFKYYSRIQELGLPSEKQSNIKVGLNPRYSSRLGSGHMMCRSICSSGYLAASLFLWSTLCRIRYALQQTHQYPWTIPTSYSAFCCALSSI